MVQIRRESSGSNWLKDGRRGAKVSIRKGTAEEYILEWRSLCLSSGGIDIADLQELEDYLRREINSLTALGLSEEEAFLIRVKRLEDLPHSPQHFRKPIPEALAEAASRACPRRSPPKSGTGLGSSRVPGYLRGTLDPIAQAVWHRLSGRFCLLSQEFEPFCLTLCRRLFC